MTEAERRQCLDDAVLALAHKAVLTEARLAALSAMMARFVVPEDRATFEHELSLQSMQKHQELLRAMDPRLVRLLSSWQK